MKPSWSDAPKWANWLAQDPDGDWYWYELEPYTGESFWFSASNSGLCFAHTDDINENWQDTLEQCPEAIETEPKYNALAHIREIAMTPDCFNVPYDSDQLKMANMVIQKMREKFELIVSIAEDQL